MEFLKKYTKERECISNVDRVNNDDTDLSNSYSYTNETWSECMSENPDDSLEVGQEVVEPLSNENGKTSAPPTPQLL